MTKADLLEAAHQADILMQPWVLYCNPDITKELKGHIPETVKLVPFSTVDKGICYLVDRAKCENLYIPCFDILGSDTDG